MIQIMTMTLNLDNGGRCKLRRDEAGRWLAVILANHEKNPPHDDPRWTRVSGAMAPDELVARLVAEA